MLRCRRPLCHPRCRQRLVVNLADRSVKAPCAFAAAVGLPASMAGLPATRAWVWVGPPLFCRGPRIFASETLGTMSVGPGVKPVTPALPLAPNKLKLFAVTILLDVFNFRPDGRLVASDQAIVESEGSGRRRIEKFAVAVYGMSR